MAEGCFKAVLRLFFMVGSGYIVTIFNSKIMAEGPRPGRPEGGPVDGVHVVVERADEGEGRAAAGGDEGVL